MLWERFAFIFFILALLLVSKQMFVNNNSLQPKIAIKENVVKTLVRENQSSHNIYAAKRSWKLFKRGINVRPANEVARRQAVGVTECRSVATVTTPPCVTWETAVTTKEVECQTEETTCTIPAEFALFYLTTIGCLYKRPTCSIPPAFLQRYSTVAGFIKRYTECVPLVPFSNVFGTTVRVVQPSTCATATRKIITRITRCMSAPGIGRNFKTIKTVKRSTCRRGRPAVARQTSCMPFTKLSKANERHLPQSRCKPNRPTPKFVLS